MDGRIFCYAKIDLYLTRNRHKQMLFRVMNFDQVVELEFNWRQFTIRKVLRYGIPGRRTRLRSRHASLGLLHRFIILNNLTQETQVFELGNERSTLWRRLGQSLVVWNRNVPLIVWQNLEYGQILYPNCELDDLEFLQI